MSEYIDKERLLRVLDKNFCSIGGAEVLKQIIESQPPADVRPVVRGEWIQRMFGTHECSNCHNDPCHYDGVTGYTEWLTDFCPNCGADMRGETK